MIFADRATPGMVDLKRQRRAWLDRALFDGTDMGVEVVGIFLRVGDLEANAIGAHHSGVADLAAGFAIERGLIENDDAALALFQRIDFLAVAQDGGNHALGALGLVAEKFGGADFVPQAEPDRSGRRLTGSGP